MLSLNSAGWAGKKSELAGNLLNEPWIKPLRLMVIAADNPLFKLQ